MLSMTGFASKSYEFAWGNLILEISSINSKYQDFSVRLPKELSSLENKILALLRKLIARGRVKLSAEINWAPGARVPIINEEGLMNFYNQVQNIAAKNGLIRQDGLATQNSITDFLLIPGILEINDSLAEQEAKNNPEIWENITREIVGLLTEMRQSEGLHMQKNIASDLDKLCELMTAMNERWKFAKDSALEGIRQRIEDVLNHYNLELDEARISEEVALVSDKWDISEEISRMQAHIEKFRLTLNALEPVGKKLDFLIQEMNREINTMGSKVNDADFRWGVVEAKTCLERMREQIQNVE